MELIEKIDVCAERNIHERSLEDIQKVLLICPFHYKHVQAGLP